MCGLLFHLLLTFPIFPRATYPDFSEEHFPSHSVSSLNFVVSIRDLKRDLQA